MWSLEALRGHDGRKIKHVEWFGSWLTNTQLSDRPPGNASPLQSGQMLTLGHKPALSCCSQRLSGVRHRLKHDKIRWCSRMQTFFFCSNQSDVFCVARSSVDYWITLWETTGRGITQPKLSVCLSDKHGGSRQRGQTSPDGWVVNPRALSEQELFGVSNALHTNLVVPTCVICNGSIKTEVVYVYLSLLLWLKKFQSAASLTRGGRLRLFVLLSDNLMC